MEESALVLDHPVHPAMRIGRAAALDVDQGGAQLLRTLGRPAIADHELAVAAGVTRQSSKFSSSKPFSMTSKGCAVNCLSGP